jgi:eukaryotic-like serine/threonine-protein kinase
MSPLRRDVESLLAQSVSAQGFLDGEALGRAAQMVSALGPSLTGRRLGPYQVQARLGAGGMGEVYRARDTKLGRDVAIKILPHAFTGDPERLVRFEREARMLAALNHPNIGAQSTASKTRTASARWCLSWLMARRWRIASRVGPCR